LKAYFIVRLFCVASILFLILFLPGCSATRYLSEDQKLVRRVKITGIDRQFTEQANLYIQRDIMPNSRLNLALYNFFNTKNGEYRTDRIRAIGEAPNLLDSSSVEISRRELEKFLFDKGFFKATVKSDVTVKDKKAYIAFIAQPGPSFSIRNFTYVIPDSAVEQLYEQNRPSFTRISTGTRYDGDSLRHESRQIAGLLQRNGYYEYKEQYVRFTVDTNLRDSAANVKMFLDNPANQPRHKVYHINTTSMLVRDSRGRLLGIPDTAVVDSQYHFTDYSHRVDAKDALRYNYIKSGDRYNIDKKNLTYDRLFDLNIFKTIKIDYAKGSDSLTLNASIDATPMKRLSNRVEGEYTFNSRGSGFNVGNTYTNRNVFGGGEHLDFRVRYGLLFTSGIQGSLSERLSRDMQFGVNLTFPRLLVPFNTEKLGKNGIPHTTISTSFQVFDQLDAFSSRLFINSLTYDWVETRTKLHSFTPINVEYRKGILNDAFEETLRRQGYFLYIATNDRQYFNLGSLYNFTYNANKLLTYENFYYLRSFLDVAGNTLSLLANTLKDDGSIFGLPYLQYAKTEQDFRIYRSLGGERQFVTRINPGIIYSYGNTGSRELPFEKNFYAGGTTGIRAWQARTLGPGNYNRDTLQSDTVRRNLTNLDQLGELKFEGNLEYRFKILNNFFGSKLKGAAFTDFGNVWRIREAQSNPGGEFKLKKIFDQIAIGAGAGLRFDVEYFIFRVDVGVKIKDPQFRGSDQWVIKRFFDRDFKDEYARTHSPDTYRFLQYNFGIGLPF
jgi:outer membrane protein insertion porin family